jgi:hypothetical protein
VPGSDIQRRVTARQRQLEVLAYRWETPLTDKQEAVERLRIKSSKEKQLETYAADPDWQ